MKTIFLLLLIWAVSFSASQAQAQDKKPVTISFWVGGACEMCKERIERAVDAPGVRSAAYNLSNHELTITYSPRKISEMEIHALLNKAGHDTASSLASEEAYSHIHQCCKYRNHEHNH